MGYHRRSWRQQTDYPALRGIRAQYRLQADLGTAIPCEAHVPAVVVLFGLPAIKQRRRRFHRTSPRRSEEHTSELQSLMRISYAVFCLKKKKIHKSTPQCEHNTHI